MGQNIVKFSNFNFRVPLWIGNDNCMSQKYSDSICAQKAPENIHTSINSFFNFSRKGKRKDSLLVLSLRQGSDLSFF